MAEAPAIDRVLDEELSTVRDIVHREYRTTVVAAIVVDPDETILIRWAHSPMRRSGCLSIVQGLRTLADRIEADMRRSDQEQA